MHSVKSVSRLTGISAHTLRAWERRYEAVLPVRTETGRRLYSDEDVQRLRMIGLLVRQGRPISELAHLPDGQLERLCGVENLKTTASRSTEPAGGSQKIVHSICRRLERFDVRGVYSLLREARHTRSTSEYLLQVVSPSFYEIGNRVALGLMEISQEHAFSALVRHELGEILYSVSGRGSSLGGLPEEADRTGTVVFSTPPGELHEFGILISAILSALRGCNVFYLGPNLPPRALALAANAVRAELVVLGTSLDGSRHQYGEFTKYLSDLDSVLRASAEVWVGGVYSERVPRLKVARRAIEAVPNLAEFDRRIQMYRRL